MKTRRIDGLRILPEKEREQLLYGVERDGEGVPEQQMCA